MGRILRPHLTRPPAASLSHAAASVPSPVPVCPHGLNAFCSQSRVLTLPLIHGSGFQLLCDSRFNEAFSAEIHDTVWHLVRNLGLGIIIKRNNNGVVFSPKGMRSIMILPKEIKLNHIMGETILV